MTRQIKATVPDTTLAQLNALRERFNLSTLTDTINYAVAAAYYATFQEGKKK